MNEQNQIKNREGIDIGQIINWILTIAFMCILAWGIYNDFIFQPTCDCSATYEEICQIVGERINNTLNMRTPSLADFVSGNVTWELKPNG